MYSDWLKKSSSSAASHMICKDCCDLERYFPVNLQDRDVFRIWSQGWCDSRNLVVRSTEPSRFMIFTWIKLLTVTFPTPIEDYPLLQIIIFDDIHYLYYKGPFLQSLKKITIKIILVLYFFMNHATSDMLISLLTNNIENHNNRRLENWRAKIT